jgi:acetylornithine deacetylase
MDHAIWKQILSEADKRSNSSIAFLQELIALTPKGELAVQNRVAAALADLGCKVDRLTYRPEDVPVLHEFASATAMNSEMRESIIATFPGSGGGKSMIFFAHPDAEPVFDTERWQRDPFAGIIENGRLYGWGVSDDLAGVAGFVEGLAVMVAAGMKPTGDILLASTPSKRHARGVFQVLHAGFRADAAVYMHPAESGFGMLEIKAASSGMLEFRVSVKGLPPDTREPSHTAFTHRAINPLDKAMLLISALNELASIRAKRVHHALLENTVGRSTNILIANLQLGTHNTYNRIASECSFGVSVSYPPGEPMAKVQAEIINALEQAQAGDDWFALHPPRIDWISGVTGAEVPEGHPLYRMVSEAVKYVTGEKPLVNPLHTSSDIRVPMIQAGIPTVGLGPLGGDLTQNGLCDEWVDVADYSRSVKVAAILMAQWGLQKDTF